MRNQGWPQNIILRKNMKLFVKEMLQSGKEKTFKII